MSDDKPVPKGFVPYRHRDALDDQKPDGVGAMSLFLLTLLLVVGAIVGVALWLF